MPDWIDVSEEDPRIYYTVGATPQTVFVVPFVFFSDADLVVYVDGAVKTLATHYTVAGEGEPAGGTVTFLAQQSNVEVGIVRDVPIVQTTHIPTFGPLDVPGINIQFSKFVAMLQQLASRFVRGIHFPDSESALSGELAPVATRKNKLLGFDTSGGIIYPLGPTFVGETSTGVAHVDSRATAQVTIFDASVNAIIVARYDAGYPLSYATYIPGTSSGPRAFQEAGGNWWELDLSGGKVNALWFGARPGLLVGDQSAAIQAAADYIAATLTNGQVYLPRGNYRITTAIAHPVGVHFVGDGILNTKISPDGCGAFTYVFLTGFGEATVRELSIEGQNGTTQIALYQAGTLDDADELYGLSFRNITIRNFNIAAKFRTVRNVTFRDCWIESVNSGIQLIGKCLIATIDNCKIVYGGGCGTGLQFAILTSRFNYTSGTGFVQPEAVRVINTDTFGFTTGVDFDYAIYAEMRGSSTASDVTGVRCGRVLSVLNIKDNYIQINGADAVVGVWVGPLAAEVLQKVNIVGNEIECVGAAAGTFGVMVASPGNGFAHNTKIADNVITGFTGRDIAVYGSTNIPIEGNWCNSALATSIEISAVPSSEGAFVYVDGNRTQGTIDGDIADVNSGRLIYGINSIAGVKTWPPVRNGTATPQGSVTSIYAGQEFYDTTASKWYKAAAANVNNAWVALN